MAFIGLGQVDRNLIPIILSCIFCLLNRIINLYGNSRLFDNKLYTNIVIALAEILNAIPYFIFRKRSKENMIVNDLKNIDSNEEEKKFEYIYEEFHDIKDEVKYKELFIFFISIIFFVNYSMFVYTFKLHSNIWITYILFTSVFYYLIFKAKLFNYHYLSIIIILLLGFIIDIIKKNYEKDWELSKIGFIFSIIRVILLSFNYVIIKYTIDKKFASPYEIGFWSGIIDLILFIIFAILDYNFFEWNTYFNYFNEINFYEILYILGLIITNFFVFTLCLVIDKNNTPCHIFIMFIFGQIVYDASHIDEPFYVIIIIIFLIIILFFSLVFNEIIELNFCGLSRNTKRNMAYRAKSEIIESNLLKKLTFDGDDEIKVIEENSRELNPIINDA